ncbi:hypothetical protein J3R82DRAFT_8490 [Butyriboletus roseoflavus]|nr:hypothetical protein J3R82DRAFT_8490 [Butyriboletus roseoflavus]
MQEAEEQDTCRICSAPGEPGQPLFYPCKCSGTIRYIHQDCLTTWLSHSKKKTCDVCKHPYTFTKVYASDMPTSLPPLLLIRRLAQQAFFVSLFGIRAVLIAIVWLALLPWITIWTWRVYFTMGESTAWWISGRERPANVRPIGIAHTLTAGNDTVSSFQNATVLHRFASRAFWKTLSSDIFAGQIIASLIVLIFVAVFLLHTVHLTEISRRVVKRGSGARIVPIPPNPRFEGPQRHFDDIERLELLREPIRRPQNARVDPFLIPPLPMVLPSENLDTTPVDTGKGKEKEAVTANSVPTALDVRRRMRFDDDENTELLSEADPSSSVTSSFIPSPSLLGSVSGCSTAIESSPFEFTFRVPADGDSEVDVREPVPDMPARSLVALQTALMTAVEDESDLKPLCDLLSPASSDLNSGHLPMLNSSLAAEDSLSLRRETPSEHFTTQSIFTYPSEVFATDSTSMPTGNMDRKKRVRDEMEEEFEHYFRDPQPAPLNPLDADNNRIDVPREMPRGIEHVYIADGEEQPPLERGSDEEDESDDDEAPEHIFWDADADREDDEDDDEDPAGYWGFQHS